MLDIKYVVENKDKVKENIKKKYQDSKLVLVDEVIDIYNKIKENKKKRDGLGNKRNNISDSIGILMRQKQALKANLKKDEVKQINEELKKICENYSIIYIDITNISEEENYFFTPNSYYFNYKANQYISEKII